MIFKETEILVPMVQKLVDQMSGLLLQEIFLDLDGLI